MTHPPVRILLTRKTFVTKGMLLKKLCMDSGSSTWGGMMARLLA